MVGVLSVFDADSSRTEEGMRILEEKIAPVLKAQKGFKRGSWVINKETGEVYALTIWEDQAALKEGLPVLQEVREHVASMATIKHTQIVDVLGLA